MGDLRLNWLSLTVAAWAAVAGLAGTAWAGADRPNVVFIMADDLGWSDTTLHGTTRLYQTPHIERLAERGIRFMQAYAASPLCSPTRASIMTGQYPGRVGITAAVCHLPEERFEVTLGDRAQPFRKAVQPVSITRLKHEYFTLAEAFKEAGYRTAHFGKWHLGREPYDPLHQGFDVDIPHTPAVAGPGGGYLAPWRFISNPDFQGRPGEHVEDRLSAEAAKFIAANKDRPFFLNYWAYSVHSPWTAKPELIEKYRRKIDPDSPQRSPLYAAMVESLDDAVGRIVEAIDAAGIAERTIIVFFSDNGAWCWTAKRKGSEVKDDTPLTSNAPLRGGKANLWEGGTRVPCVVVWPGRTKPGARTDALFSSVDFYPTLLEMAGLKPRPGQTLDGVSQVPALLGEAAPRDTVYCLFPQYTPATGNIPGAWVRRGDWKLLRFFCDGEDQRDRFELYNLKDDLGETQNLAARHPDRVRELNALLDRHLKHIEATLPKANPDYRADAQAPDLPGRKQ